MDRWASDEPARPGTTGGRGVGPVPGGRPGRHRGRAARTRWRTPWGTPGRDVGRTRHRDVGRTRHRDVGDAGGANRLDPAADRRRARPPLAGRGRSRRDRGRAGHRVAGGRRPIGAVAVYGLPRLLRQTSAAASIATIEAVATWTEMLQGTLAASAGLGQAIIATADLSPAPIRQATEQLAAQLRAGVAPRAALLQFAEDGRRTRVPTASCARCSWRSPPGPSAWATCCSALAESTREEVSLRLRIETSRASVRSGVRTVVVFSVVFAAGLALLARSYLAPFGSASRARSSCLAVGALYAAGLTLHGRTGPTPRRRSGSSATAVVRAMTDVVLLARAASAWACSGSVYGTPSAPPVPRRRVVELAASGRSRRRSGPDRRGATVRRRAGVARGSRWSAGRDHRWLRIGACGPRPRGADPEAFATRRVGGHAERAPWRRSSCGCCAADGRSGLLTASPSGARPSCWSPSRRGQPLTVASLLAGPPSGGVTSASSPGRSSTSSS